MCKVTKQGFSTGAGGLGNSCKVFSLGHTRVHHMCKTPGTVGRDLTAFVVQPFPSDMGCAFTLVVTVDCNVSLLEHMKQQIREESGLTLTHGWCFGRVDI